MAARLKVFVTSDGLTDYVVATTSRAKALAAWGVRQDLFKEGAAHETEDADLAAAARARPGEVLRRPTGGRAKLARLTPIGNAKRPPRSKPPSRAARAKVADLERKAAAAEAIHRKALAHIEAARARIEARAAKVEASYQAARNELQARLQAARRALGEPAEPRA